MEGREARRQVAELTHSARRRLRSTRSPTQLHYLTLRLTSLQGPRSTNSRGVSRLGTRDGSTRCRMARQLSRLRIQRVGRQHCLRCNSVAQGEFPLLLRGTANGSADFPFRQIENQMTPPAQQDAELRQLCRKVADVLERMGNLRPSTCVPPRAIVLRTRLLTRSSHSSPVAPFPLSTALVFAPFSLPRNANDKVNSPTRSAHHSSCLQSSTTIPPLSRPTSSVLLLFLYPLGTQRICLESTVVDRCPSFLM